MMNLQKKQLILHNTLRKRAKIQVQLTDYFESIVIICDMEHEKNCEGDYYGY